jgi:hypothetical protein
MTAPTIIDGAVGVDVTLVTSPSTLRFPPFRLGTVVRSSDGNSYLYVQAAQTLTAGDNVTVDGSFNATVGGSDYRAHINVPSGFSAWVQVATSDLPERLTTTAQPANTVNLFADNTTTRKGVVSWRFEHPGPHTGESYSSVHIETRPEGAGVNLPSRADFSLTVSNIKNDWASSSATPGEIDGIYSVVRQGGPDADVGVEKSDAACFLGDITSRGPVGFATVLEGVVSNLDRTTGDTSNQIQVQLGAIFNVPVARGTAEQYGLVLTSNVGANRYGLFVQEQGGTWVDYIRCMATGGTTRFAVSNTRTTLATTEILAANLPAYASDSAANAGSLPVGGLYKANGVIRVREGTSALPVTRQRFVFASGYTNQAVTGTTAETALATITIPAGMMGTNGRLYIEAQFQTTIVSASSNTKTVRIRFGGISGNVLGSIAATTQTNLRLQSDLANRNSASSQWNQTLGNSATGLGMSILNVTGISINTANAQDIVISGQLQDATDTITLNAFIVEFIPG